MKKTRLAILAATALSLTLGITFTGCSKKEAAKKGKSIAVFVPGIIDDSPIYEKLVKGAQAATIEYNSSAPDEEKVSIFILEAGTNQAEWGQKLAGLAAEQKYDLILSSNPSLPDLAEPILEDFPKQKFILLDATKAGNPNIYTVCYNQYEQAYLTGYIGGLMSKSHKVALVAAQEYPVMNKVIFPSFERGAKDADGTTSLDFRVVGNWYDATKGQEIADALCKAGVDVILPICGGAAQGVINSAVNNKAYITWFDSNGFDRAPGTIISSSIADQQEMADLVVKEFLEGKTKWGQAEMVGISDGFVTFIQDDPNYIKTVPEEVRSKMASLIEEIKDGSLKISE